MAFGSIDLQSTSVAASFTFTNPNDLIISFLMANKGTTTVKVTGTLRGQTLFNAVDIPANSSLPLTGLKLATSPTDVISIVTDGQPVDTTITTLAS